MSTEIHLMAPNLIPYCWNCFVTFWIIRFIYWSYWNLKQKKLWKELNVIPQVVISLLMYCDYCFQSIWWLLGGFYMSSSRVGATLCHLFMFLWRWWLCSNFLTIESESAYNCFTFGGRCHSRAQGDPLNWCSSNKY
jgi:hypothetical protein